MEIAEGRLGVIPPGTAELALARLDVTEGRAFLGEESFDSTERRRAWLLRRALLGADTLTLGVSFLLVTRFLMPVEVAASQLALLLGVALPGFVVIAKIYGLYDQDEERPEHSTADELGSIAHMLLTGVFVCAAGAWATGLATPSLPRYLLFWLAALLLAVPARATTRALVRRSHRASQRTIIVGAGEVGQLVARKLLQHREYGVNLLGFVDGSPKSQPENVEVLGSPEDLPELVEQLSVDRVIVAFSNDRSDELVSLVRSLKSFAVRVDIVPRLYEVISPGLAIHSIEGIPLVSLPPLQLSRSSRLLKRTVDIVLSLLGLIFFAPFMALIAVWIKFDSPGPVFFRQFRMGADGKRFRIVKFRTMTVDADARKEDVAHLNVHAKKNGDPRMFKIFNDPRVTSCGWFLRRHSLDEVPQLINVLIGQMTLVGPRPLILEEDRHVPEWGRSRLDLKPGVTGLWQVLGSSTIPFAEMVKLDYLYVTNWSVWNDLRLLLKSFRVLAGRELA
jgi:exopolysaccharide biosynthesis polyprenyl glycosylphosphotransferase